MSLSLFDLSGKTVLITGSSAGIGHALARGLGQAGAKVIINGRRPDWVEFAANMLHEDEIDAECSAFDVHPATGLVLSGTGTTSR